MGSGRKFFFIALDHGYGFFEMVQEKREVFFWNYKLQLPNSLTIIGTFITRKGVLNSVHAFARSNIGPAFLVFIAITNNFCLFAREQNKTH